MSQNDFHLSVSNAADWWKGFNASSLKRRCSVDWRNGFNDAREVERRLNVKAAKGRAPYNPILCVNCFEPIPSNKRTDALTCCRACQQIAEGVRGLRRWVSFPGNVLNMDEIDQRQRFVCCAVSKDGYDKHARSIPPELRDFVFQRAGYQCDLCGKPQGNSLESMLTIQHMRGASNDPDDLRAYCRQCNTIEALCMVTSNQLASYSPEQLARLNLVEVENPDALREPHIEVLMREIQLRVLAAAPILPCDDSDAWKDHYRVFQGERRNHLKAERAAAAKLARTRDF
jgi:hypothetical protein